MSEFYKERNGQLSFVKPPNYKISDNRAKYSYNGPVFYFDKFIATVNVSTWANSVNKARSNMLYQIKEKLGYQPNVKLKIIDNQIHKEELKYGKCI